MEDDHQEKLETPTSTTTDPEILANPVSNQSEDEDGSMFPIAGFLLGISLVLMSLVAFTVIRRRYRSQESEDPVEGFSDDYGLDHPNHGAWSASNLYSTYTDEEMNTGVHLNPYALPSGPVLRDFEPATSY